MIFCPNNNEASLQLKVKLEEMQYDYFEKHHLNQKIKNFSKNQQSKQRREVIFTQTNI